MRARLTGARSAILRTRWWWIGAVILLLISLGIVRWAKSRPGYDPYGWLVWGYQTVHGSLDLGGAPSWKPLTFLFTVPYSLAGAGALWLWMVTSVAISLAGCVFAARLAYRLTQRYAPERSAAAFASSRIPALAAGAFSGVALLGIDVYIHDILSVQSDPMIVSLCLAAIDCHLHRRHRWAFVLILLAGLGRPETFPFLFLYGLWLWRYRAPLRWLVIGGWGLLVFLWFGVPTITNGRPFIAGQLAQASPRALKGNKVIGIMHRFIALQYLPIELMALLTILRAWFKRRIAVLVVAGCAALWMIVEVAFVLRGWPGVPRYMFEPAGVVAVLAGVGVGWVLREGPSFAGNRWWVGVPVAALLVGGLIPGGISRVRYEHNDVLHERVRTVQINRLATAIRQIGGPKTLLACGQPVLNVEYVSVLGWLVHLNTGVIGYRPAVELQQSYTIVEITGIPNGWYVTPYHVTAADRPACTRVNGLFVPTARHPGGVMIHKPLR